MRCLFIAISMGTDSFHSCNCEAKNYFHCYKIFLLIEKKLSNNYYHFSPTWVLFKYKHHYHYFNIK